MNAGIAGNRGDSVRSDCYVKCTIGSVGGWEIEVESKVEAMYGASIRNLAEQILSYYEIEHAHMVIEDKGALPFVLAARLECAIKKVTAVEKPFLLPLINESLQRSTVDRYRRSRLYLPGNNPKIMLNAGLHGADGIILDLEDSVAPQKKFEARFLVRNALRHVNFGEAERMVRINQIPEGLDDLPYVIPYGVDLVLIPKCENADQIVQVNESICELLQVKESPIFLMPIIESAKGILNAYDIASAATNIVAIAIGLEDYSADIGAQRTVEGKESFYARSVVVNASRAAGIQPIDSVFSDVAKVGQLRKTALESRGLGFVGMGCIHPRQIGVINECYSPTVEELERAQKIVDAYNIALEKGEGVVSIGSKMIDPPIVKRALNVIRNADVLSKNRRNNHG
ncbi:citrate lyase ACP [Puteibacter caeruleilacunae]|nr:citrate lyase ACP [Puteibacter caeruleilacunae]